MKRKNQQILFASIGIILFSLCIGYVHNSYNELVRIGLIAAIPLISALFFIGIFRNKEKLYKISLIIVYIGLFFLIMITLIVKSNILKEIDSADDIVKVVNSFGSLGKLIFVGIQFLQVTFIPLPSTIVTAAGAAIYPPWEALLLSCIGLVIGSIFAFFLGKTFGVRLIKWFVGEEAMKKYYKFVKGKDKAMLTFMFIFPAFPDDVLCLIAGLTSMNSVSFLIIQLISRPLNVAGTVFIVDNISAIPFSGIGILIWISIALLFVAALILMWKYAPKLEYLMLKGIGKLIGKPLIKDIDIIVAEQFKKKKVIKEEKKEEPAPVIAEEKTDTENITNKENEVLATVALMEASVLSEEQLHSIVGNILNKKIKQMKF